MPIYYIDTAVGNDSNSGTSPGSGNAWATIQKFVTTAATGDTGYVKASGNYNEMVTMVNKPGFSNEFLLEGYTSTPGDGGRVIIDAQNTRNNCFLLQTTGSSGWEFRNFQFQGSPSGQPLFFLNVNNVSRMTWNNCRFTNGLGSPSGGVVCGSGISLNVSIFRNCEFDNLSGIAIGSVVSSYVQGCTIRDINSSDQIIYTNGSISVESCIFVNCTGTSVIELNPTTSAALFVNNNSFYNVGGTSTKVINTNFTGTQLVVVLNNIFSNVIGGSSVCIIGSSAGYNPGSHFIGYNAFYNVNSKYSNVYTIGGDLTLTASPYTNPGSYNLSLNNASDGGELCKGRAYGNKFPFSVGTGTSSLCDIGASQS